MSDAPTRDENGENGETVAGTSEDDLFNESTVAVPSYVDKDAVPDDELEAIERVLSSSIGHVASTWEKYTVPDIKRIVDKHLKEEHIRRIRDYDQIPSVSLDELSEAQRPVVEAFMDHPEFPDISASDFAREAGFNTSTARRGIHKAFHGLREFEDLNPGTQLSILIWAYEGDDASETGLADKYPPSSTTLGETKRTYPDLIAEKRPVDKSELDAAAEAYGGSRTQTASQGGESTTRQSTTKPVEEKDYDDLTPKQKSVVDAISESPGDVATDIAEGQEFGYWTVYKTVRDYPHIVKKRIEEVGAVDSVEGIHDNILDKTDDLGEWDLTETPEQPEIKTELESELEFEFEEELGIDLEDEFDVTPISPSRFEPEEEVVFISRDLSAQAKEYIDGTDEYSSVTQFARAAMRKELNGEYDDSTEPPSTDARTDMIEAVIELADVDPSKADAIRTLINNE